MFFCLCLHFQDSVLYRQYTRTTTLYITMLFNNKRRLCTIYYGGNTR